MQDFTSPACSHLAIATDRSELFYLWVRPLVGEVQCHDLPSVPSSGRVLPINFVALLRTQPRTRDTEITEDMI